MVGVTEGDDAVETTDEVEVAWNEEVVAEMESDVVAELVATELCIGRNVVVGTTPP